jgi:hypothetical protein
VAGNGKAEKLDEMVKKIASGLSLWLNNGMGIKN